MKKLFQIMCLLLAGGLPSSAQVPQTAEEVKAMMFISKLGEIATLKGEKVDSLSLKSIKSILENNKNDLYGGMGEFSKFATLQDLCKRLEKHPERKELQETLFELFKTLPLMQGKPKNWNEILVQGEGGSLGLITKCLLVSAGEDFQLKIVDHLIEENQPDKAKLVLEKAKITGKKAELANLLRQKVEAAKSEEIKNLFSSFIEERSSK
jgi:DNA-binding Xre family transcriptional regulator